MGWKEECEEFDGKITAFVPLIGFEWKVQKSRDKRVEIIGPKGECITCYVSDDKVLFEANLYSSHYDGRASDTQNIHSSTNFARTPEQIARHFRTHVLEVLVKQWALYTAAEAKGKKEEKESRVQGDALRARVGLVCNTNEHYNLGSIRADLKYKRAGNGTPESISGYLAGNVDCKIMNVSVTVPYELGEKIADLIGDYYQKLENQLKEFEF